MYIMKHIYIYVLNKPFGMYIVKHFHVLLRRTYLKKKMLVEGVMYFIFKTFYLFAKTYV